jgi:4-hydroxymandelate oxidase
MQTIMCLATLATTSLEDVAAASPAPKWFQLYVFRDREITRDLVQRAAANGYQAIVLTVDVPGVSRRERDMRIGFHLPDGVAMRNLSSESLRNFPADAVGSGLTAYIAQQIDPTLTWDALNWLAGLSDLPIVVKGILTEDDAKLAADHGARAVVVSNHGGRQLDSTLTALDELPQIAAAIGATVEVYIDGGVRRGTDVLKALALGARAVMIARPVLWGLAADGEIGARHVLTLLRDEIANDMRLAGIPDVAALNPTWLMRNPRFGA